MKVGYERDRPDDMMTPAMNTLKRSQSVDGQHSTRVGDRATEDAGMWCGECIKSVQNIKKITSAMKMVCRVKMGKKAQVSQAALPDLPITFMKLFGEVPV
jgi:hypothetical protein